MPCPAHTLIRPRGLSASDQSSTVLKALKRIPTIGEVTAQKLMQQFGDAFLASMLGDNIHEFINLMNDRSELVFSDRQAHRMEHAMANMEFGFGEGGYQPSEFIKRQLPQGTFDLLIADEVHVRCGRTGMSACTVYPTSPSRTTATPLSMAVIPPATTSGATRG